MWDRVTVKTKPSELAVSLADLKAHCDIDYSDDDALLTGLLEAAIAKIDSPNGIGIACAEQTWILSLDCFESFTINLLGWPVKSITSIKYIDMDGVETTLNASEYDLDADGDFARLSPVYRGSWPSTRLQNGAVKIEYVLGEAVSDINPLLTLAIKQMASHWYEHRESAQEMMMHNIPMGADQIIKDFMRGSIS